MFNIKHHASRLKLPLLLASSFLLLAILFTWPLASQITTHGFGINEDSPYHIWHNWWFKYSIFNLHQSPLYTNYIFYPQTIPLTFDANAFVFSALTLPLQPIFGVLTASNIVFLLSFVLSGMGTFYLAKYALGRISPTDCHSERSEESLGLSQISILTPTNIACFLAGLIYAFSPYTLSQAIDGHTNLTSTWIIPLYTLFLLKALRGVSPLNTKYQILNTPESNTDNNQNPGKKQVAKYSLIAGLFFALQAYNDLTYTAFTIILTGLILLIKAVSMYRYDNNMKNKKLNIKNLIRDSLTHLIKPVIITGFISLILFLPVLIPTFKDYKKGINPSAPLWVQNVWSADLLAFLRPSTNSTIFNKIAFAPHQGSIEGTVFLGWTTLALCLIYLTSKALNVAGRKGLGWFKGPWLILAPSFFLLSLGPFLNINNHWQWILFDKQIFIPLPFILIHKIPLIGGTQEPARFNPFLMMPLAILAAKGFLLLVSSLNSKFKILNSWKLNLVFALPLTFIVLEFLQLPFPTTNLRPPKIYEIIANDPRPVAVLDLPLGFNSGNISLGYTPIGSLQYYQVIHQHASFRGTVARIPTWAFDYYRELPVIKYFLNPDKPPDEKDLNPILAKKTLKEKLNVGYIIVHRGVYKEKSIPFGKTEDLINNVLGARKIYEENNVVAYKLD